MTEEKLVMSSVAQIADRDKVSKQAVSKAVKKLLDERPDTPVVRGNQGQVLQVSLAHYDEYRQRFVNPAKATAPIRSISTGASGPLDPSDSFDEARRQNEWLKLGRERIKHQEDLKQLVRKDKVEEANRIIAREIQNIVKRLPNNADQLALAVSKEGVHGVRVLLRTIAFDLGNAIADRLVGLANEAPETDELIEDEEA
ncbi:hypothetical protein [Rhizobium sp. BT04]|uniref:hypothetical protein n=1 Tax=Rhizobium sp. BT04 TaxID=3045157 RepID=UPI0024B3D569|nr:hypothetical protein [Rhizobium sp. BT04]